MSKESRKARAVERKILNWCQEYAHDRSEEQIRLEDMPEELFRPLADSMKEAEPGEISDLVGMVGSYLLIATNSEVKRIGRSTFSTDDLEQAVTCFSLQVSIEILRRVGWIHVETIDGSIFRGDTQMAIRIDPQAPSPAAIMSILNSRN